MGSCYVRVILSLMIICVCIFALSEIGTIHDYNIEHSDFFTFIYIFYSFTIIVEIAACVMLRVLYKKYCLDAIFYQCSLQARKTMIQKPLSEPSQMDSYMRQDVQISCCLNISRCVWILIGSAYIIFKCNDILYIDA